MVAIRAQEGLAEALHMFQALLNLNMLCVASRLWSNADPCLLICHAFLLTCSVPLKQATNNAWAHILA